MIFTWDPEKKARNVAKHGVAFEDAHYIFADQTLTFVDDRFDYGETRYITLGKLVGRVIVVVHTLREDTIRIISMRKANEKETRLYQERLKKT